MKRPGAIGGGALAGALAGLTGGLVFGAAMTQLGMLPTIASLVRAESPAVGFLVHMLIAAVVGAGFGVLVRRQRPGLGETLFWGLAYGALWWFLGTLTLLPLFLGRPVAWDAAAARLELPALLGHLVYGATVGLALVVFRIGSEARGGTLSVGPAALVRGALSGLIGAWLLGTALEGQNGLSTISATMAGRPRSMAWIGLLLLGAVCGSGYAILYPRSTSGAGAALIRGAAYGFFWWVVGGLTLVPIAEGSGLAWSAGSVREGFATFPGYLLFLGVAVGLFYHWISFLTHLLFSDDIRTVGREGFGTLGLRAVARGALAGLVGGAVFTLVMVQIGFLPTVARLVGSRSLLTGLIVHLMIAQLIGASYGLLFRRHSYDLGSALGWGLAYGFIWWLIGPLTLMPILLGSGPQWTADAAAAAYPSLVGHLGYGAGLGVTFYLLEKRYSPWWVSRSQAEAQRAELRRDQLMSSAPALWALMVLIALIVPILLGE